MNQKHLQHLYARAGFGVPKSGITTFGSSSDKYRVVDELFSDSKITTKLEVDISEFLALTLSDIKNKTVRQEFQKKSNQKLKIFNHEWIKRLNNSDAVLREKMTLFWANHFVVKDNNIVYVQQFHNTLRAHALGNFGNFAKAISKEASMLKYLNTKQSRKAKPNENFARELMELFTLGEGNYTEKDVKQSAKAFTGYNHDLRGNFQMRPKQHDENDKTFFGKTGNFNGDDIIDIILEQKQCANFICTKIYRYFVNDNVNNNHVAELSEVFYKDYNIENLMRHLFTANWFYNEENIGSKIKSPIEFLVGMQQIVPFEFENTKELLKIQKLLGQILLNPPNVAGWKGGRSWIDSNTMMLRLKLPSVLLSNAKISVQAKGELEDSYAKYYEDDHKKRFAKVKVDWDVFDKTYQDLSFNELKKLLIVTPFSSGTQAYIDTLSQNSKRNFCVQLMSLPEYQMC